MTISRHTSSLIVDGTRYEPTQVRFVLDEERVPFAHLEATVPLNGDVAADLDPRQPAQRVLLTMRQDFGEGDTLAAISADYAGLDLTYLEDSIEPVNLNPGFEGTLDGWEPWDEFTVLELSQERVRSGEWALRLTDPEFDEPVLQGTADGAAMVRDGFGFRAEAWLYVESPDPTFAAWLAIEYLDDDGEVVDGWTIEDSTWPTGEWVRLRGGAGTPDTAGIVSARPLLVVEANSLVAFVDDVTLRAERGVLGSLSGDYGRPWNPFGVRPSTYRRANLWLRNRVVDHGAGTVSLEAASGEAMLADYALTDPQPLTPGGSTVRDAVNMVLARVLGTAVSTVGTGTETVEADALPWEPGETAWSYLTSITGAFGLRLWCDEVGIWHLSDPELTVVPGGLSMGPEQATVLDDSIDREANGWADSAVVEYVWTDSNGDRQTRYDTTAAGTRTITRTVERPMPGRGFARAIARKHNARGRVIRLAGVADYDVEPLQAALLTVPDAAVQAGVVSAVTWTQPDDVMEVRTRDLMSITEDSWLYTPPGIAWDDVPAGLSWTDYKWGEF